MVATQSSILTVTETARLAGISEDAIRRAADRGELDVMLTANKRRIFQRSAVEAFILKRANQAA